jgi:hypothetical protein
MSKTKNKKAQDAAFSSLSSSQQKRLRQRQLVLAVMLLLLSVGVAGTLNSWYSVAYGEIVINSVNGIARAEGKLLIAAMAVTAFFTSFNLLNREELDWPNFLGSLVSAGALLWFWFTTWENKSVFEDIAQLETFQKMVKEGRGGILANIKLTMLSGLWVSVVATVNLVLSSAFLLFLQPSSFTNDENN